MFQCCASVLELKPDSLHCFKIPPWVSWHMMNGLSFLFSVCIFHHSWFFFVSFLMIRVVVFSRVHKPARHQQRSPWPPSGCHADTLRVRHTVITLIMEFLNSIYRSNFLRSPPLSVFPGSSSSKCLPLAPRCSISNLRHGRGTQLIIWQSEGGWIN